MSKLRLNILGCGNVGRSLATLWYQTGFLNVGEILTTSADSAKAAANTIGAGSPIASFNHFTHAQVWMIATPDSRIEDAAAELSKSKIIREGDIVFHCSGALSSEVLSSLHAKGAQTASLHPIKTFPKVIQDLEDFKETYCGIEGEQHGVEFLTSAVTALNAVPLIISKEHKKLYHAASVMSCNYLTSLTAISIQLLRQSGVEEATAKTALQPIMRETLDNIFKLGTKNALTGPIQRGEAEIVESQLKALKELNSNYATVYQSLGKEALTLASLPAESAKEIEKILNKKTTEQ